MFKHTKLLSQNYNSTAKVVVNQGGTWSGKTYNILECLILKAIESNCFITVVGEDIPSLKRGAIRDLHRIYDSNLHLARYLKKGGWAAAYNISDRILTFANGSKMEFLSYDNEQDARSGKRDYLFINEANAITYEIYWQLFIRTDKQVFIDYNPSERFWVHDKVLPRPDAELIISDHRSNHFISKSMHREIESIEDEQLFKVYARGATGQVKGLVFQNWRMVEEFPANCENQIMAMDWGYTNSYTTLIKVGMFCGEVYAQELIYERGLQNEDILIYLKTLGISTTQLIVGDSEDPKTIDWIRAQGYNIIYAEKGPGSLHYSLTMLKSYRINLTTDSVNLKKEFQRYKYKVHKDGDILNEPVKKFDHGIDALRYGFMELAEPSGFYYA